MDPNATNSAPAATPAESAPASTEIVNAPATTAGEGDSPQHEPGDGHEPGNEPQPPKRQRFQDRIDELTRQRYEERRAREQLEAELATVKRQQELAQQFSQIDAQAPRIDQFQTLQEYMQAHANWAAQRGAAIAQAQWEEQQRGLWAQQARAMEMANAERAKTIRENAVLDEKMQSGVKKYPDFVQTVTNPDLPSVRGTPLFEAVLAADSAVDIAYFLAKNPAELDRLLSIRDPIHIAREVFRLDTKFAGAGLTSAPHPPPQRTGSSQGSKDYSQMTTAEHVKAYREAKRKRMAG